MGAGKGTMAVTQVMHDPGLEPIRLHAPHRPGPNPRQWHPTLGLAGAVDPADLVLTSTYNQDGSNGGSNPESESGASYVDGSGQR